jgi:hypothetical protein
MIHGGGEWLGRNQSATLRVLAQRGELCSSVWTLNTGEVAVKIGDLIC